MNRAKGKVGRNKKSCLHYVQTKAYEHNKIRKMKKHLKHFADDLVAVACLDRNKLILGVK